MNGQTYLRDIQCSHSAHSFIHSLGLNIKMFKISLKLIHNLSDLKYTIKIETDNQAQFCIILEFTFSKFIDFNAESIALTTPAIDLVTYNM